MKLWCSGCGGKEKDTKSAAQSRILSFYDLVTLGLGSSFSVGIFVLFGGVIKNVAGPANVISVALAAVTALVGGLCFSEFGVRSVRVYSAYAYSYFWGREHAAFIFGWTLILEYVAGTASAARGIVAFVDALAGYKISEFMKGVFSTNYHNLFPFFDFFSLGIVIVLTISIAFGLKDFLIVKRIFTICNALLVVSVITAGAFMADISNWQAKETTEEESTGGFAPFGVLGVIKGAAFAFYGFVGFDRVGVSGHEIQKQKKNLPIAILFTIFAAFLAHAGVGAVLTLMLPYERLNPYAAVPYAFEEIGCLAGKWVAAVAAFFGFQTSLFGAMFPVPRIIHAMANDGLLFPCLGNSHRKIPLAATLTGGLLTATAAGIFTFQKLVNLVVIGALFAYTILAINVIHLRYSPKPDNEEMLSDSWKNLINNTPEVSVKAVVKNCFNFKTKHPTNLTGKIITFNVILFCISSLGLSVVINFFYDSLVRCVPAAVAPGSILLCVVLFNLISMTCQPKSQEAIPFKVPLVPALPCLSIFLNIFLMLTFDSTTWTLFAGWVVLGILPHFAWRLIKCFRGEMGENSLYEINRINAVKLNESIWKIKSDKKSFYKGAVNPVFTDDSEERFNEMNGGVQEVKTRNEKTALQLKEAEIIQTAELVMEEKADSFDSEIEIDFISVDGAEIFGDLLEDNGKVQWECVAEIHKEEEFPQQNVALEIVDHTYNFLSEVAEELTKGNTNSSRELAGSEKESLSGSENFFNGSDSSQSSVNLSKEKHNNELRKTNGNNADSVTHDGYSENSDLSSDKNNSVSASVDDTNEAQNGGTISVIAPAAKASKLAPEEQNKVKEFKEKLNQLLKYNIKSDIKPGKNSSSKSTETNDEDPNNNKDENRVYNNIKTLNKSQIKDKLELLLSKGPPKRTALKDSFNIKITKTEKEIDSEKEGDEPVKNGNGKELFVESSSTLEDRIKEKILALRNVSKDICC